MATGHTAERFALIAAGVVIVLLTAGAFWLSYAHLADVAGQHGLGNSPIRRWAWPATLDAFIVAGELLMLRASLRQVTDLWAVAVTAIGSVGSIALNVAGVSGTSDSRTVHWLDYVVAAVPPTAALLAFGVLMRQIHQLVERPDGHRKSVPESTPPAKVVAPSSPPGEGKDRGDAPTEHPDPDRLADTETRPGGEATSKPPKPTGARPRRTGRPQDISDDEIRAIAREVMTRTGTASPTEIVEEIRVNRGRKVGNGRVKNVCDELNAQMVEPGPAIAVSSSTS
ncbi:DUF2637 domain-containing protein [Streptomyces sp. WAC00288]|uniref:DUF2637 domain-containing protein n=1 Tax=unclassified Streptomyces TaxID=2593676 RepID=UPI0007869C5F|nr:MULTISPECIES: DUF2637 domain-containing protein [unclassified Streptomyces]AVH96766.1 DUF2637 domain-containing protein [Streptomyces sp. WAC00288]KYG55390.1 hypothetical protein AWI43_13940 [Streptomyces sp. WAC04657]